MHIVIDANIGAGKTTLLQQLKDKYTGFVYWEENVSEWMSEGWLEKYYSDIPRYAASFQTRVLLSHLEQKRRYRGGDVNISERCGYSNVYIFSQMLLEEGNLDKLEMELHERLLHTSNYQKPDLLIYLKTTPETAYARLCNRNRDGETTISRHYLDKLGDLYERNVNKLAERVVVVDADRSAEEVFGECEAIFGGLEGLKELV